MAIPVISVAQMREWEKVTWASGQSETEVIRQAGAAVARQAESMVPPGQGILVLAGKGHNGDDARQAASQINGRPVAVLAVTNPQTAGPALTRCLEPKPALIIDGLFGIGLNRNLSSPWMDLIRRVNESGRPVLAVDVPSGLDANLGTPLDIAIRATCTLTLGAVKNGLIEATAWPFVGQLKVARDIGLIEYPFDTELSLAEPDDFEGYPPPRSAPTHKGSFGHLCLIAGSLGYHGAAVLAARGAQRAQPGLITLQTDPAVYTPVASQLQSVMVHPWRDPLSPSSLPANTSAILAGPGLASEDLPDSLRESVRSLWRDSRLPVIIDASALDWIPPGPTPPGTLRVITPHPGEAARLLQTTVTDVQHQRPRALAELSRRWGHCWVVLKGHLTLTGRDRDPLGLNPSGNPHLAQGGSGDLLAGYLAACLAQPDLQSNPTRTLRYAVWQHGRAADRLSQLQPNWTVEDLAAVLGQA